MLRIEDIDLRFQELISDPANYHREGSVVSLFRHGSETLFELTQIAGIGFGVVDGEKVVPVTQYVQSEVLGLPRLAQQISRVLQRNWEKRPAKFIDGHARFRAYATGSGTEEDSVLNRLRSIIAAPPVANTQLIQLMAPAGQGKTALLEWLAIQCANEYRAQEHPTPILIPVDLLGRYVGNIDDAVAGSLNNTYDFPLTQREVVACMKWGWIVLALDGFDELVARVGSRDAFIKITELVDQMDTAGSVILSAREGFFDLYQVSASIRTHLQPKRGAYSTVGIQLLGWKVNQAIEVFKSLGSEDAERDLRELLNTFENDQQLIFHPIFLTRLAKLWVVEKERFKNIDVGGSHLERSDYVFRILLEREEWEKWIETQTRKPLLDTAGHIAMLGAVAEEMWRSGAFRLAADELRIAAELGLMHLQLEAAVKTQIIEKVPTHAALVPKEGATATFGFLHESFFAYFLGARLAVIMMSEDTDSLSILLSERELSPELTDWTVWFFRREGGSLRNVTKVLSTIGKSHHDYTASTNASAVCAGLLNDSREDGISLHDLNFADECLMKNKYDRVTFHGCKFVNVDLGGTQFIGCEFIRCLFDGFKVDSSTVISSRFLDCEFRRLEVLDNSRGGESEQNTETLFNPVQILEAIQARGATTDFTEDIVAARETVRQVQPKLIKCVTRLVRQSNKTSDVAVEDLESDFGDLAEEVVKAGIDSGVLRDVHRQTSGKAKNFVRFQVDKERFLQAQTGDVGDVRIDAFWALAEQFQE
ncbi:MAG: hypothetical protein AMXMBFR33_15620 [Candidatus Xenobia bacterium]